MKILFFIFISLCLITNSYSNTKTKIRQQATYLHSKGRLEKKIIKKLNVLAQEIIAQEKKLENLKKQIKSLDLNIKSNEADIQERYKRLNILKTNNKQLMVQKKELQSKIVDIIAKDFANYLISDKNYIKSKNSIIADEVIEKMSIILKNQFGKLSRSYEDVNSKISSKREEIKTLKKKIDSFQKQKQKIYSLKKEQENAIKKLSSQKKNYKYRLYKIKKEKTAIRETLEKLKILNRAENLKVQREKELKKRVKHQKGGKVNVRQIGSSYQSSKVKRYRGAKTIAPLKSFVLKRKFGNYIDPIYHIKIFNDSVILSSKIKNAKVKNILNGKVVFAKDTAVLDRVIIIENSNGIHTIYAHLSKIAPTIRVGKKIRKGYVIGRVERDLTFEVTQKNYHINPLQLIRLN